MDVFDNVNAVRASTMDDYNPTTLVAFVVISVLFGATAAILGRGINKLVGPKVTAKSLGYRILLNTILLLGFYVLLPWNVVHQIQANLPGVLFAGVLISSQTWL
jgi:hypothetical protein